MGVIDGILCAMNEGNEQYGFDFSQGSGRTSADSLESAASYLQGSAGTGDQGNVRRSKFRHAFEALLVWGEDQGRIKDAQEFAFLADPPTAAGHEHEVWFDEKTNRWFKATYPNLFGLGWGHSESATAEEYFRRLVLQNRFFGDDIRLEALVNSDRRLRVLTSQPHIRGEPAKAYLIKTWFERMGFKRLVSDESFAWYHQEYNLLIADAHEGNVILTDDNYLVPIDLNLVEPDEEMRQEISRILVAD